jgi:dipeptidyl aminopeptidase/acylaminoacyl peptidase
MITRLRLLLLFVFIVLLGIGVFLWIKNSSTSDSVFPLIRKSQIQPTPMPYEELTIPYLRNREYKSSLSEQSPYSSGSNYQTYLTSYDSDGLQINGLLTVPTTEKPVDGYPAIVFVHGYIPPAQYATTEKYIEYVDYLARNGFVVFKIDLRGHGNSEGEAGGGYYGSDYVIDTLNARAALQASDFVNSEKVGLWGHSMAGNAALRAMAVQPDIPAIAIWAGAVYSYEDQRKYGIQDTSYSPPANTVQRQNRRRDLFEKVGSPSAQSPFWRQVAPIYYLEDLQGAVGLFHAVNDDVVNIGYSRDLATELSNNSVAYEKHEYPSGGHNIEGGNFSSAMQDTVAFYKKYLSN